ncbi:MAG: tetratricopeptide repeat protein, partial [Panacagrimonas sp.]
TGADPMSLARYETALGQFQSYVGDPIATIDEALAATPAFVAGHLLKALVLYTLAERKYVPMAEAALAEARRHAAQANSRERGLIAATERLVAGDWHRATLALDRVLAEYPRDALALQVAHLLDFYRGDALNLRNRISRVLPDWDATLPGYSYVLGMHAFGLEEMNQYGEAEATALRALALQPKDGWAVHAAVHVMEMQGRIGDGIAFLELREPDWAPDNAFAFHNFWHLALFHLDGGDYQHALALFDKRIHPEPAAYLLSLVDATALLWRLTLEDADVGERFAKVADDWAARLDGEAGFYAFNDAHAAMAFVATGRERELGQLTLRMREAAAGTNANAAMTRDVGLPLVEALTSFGRGRYGEALDTLESMRDLANRFGGSHAQRDVITLTMIEAAIRAGDRARARHYIAERLVHKPASAWGPRLARRAGAGPRPSTAP